MPEMGAMRLTKRRIRAVSMRVMASFGKESRQFYLAWQSRASVFDRNWALAIPSFQPACIK